MNLSLRGLKLELIIKKEIIEKEVNKNNSDNIKKILLLESFDM